MLRFFGILLVATVVGCSGSDDSSNSKTAPKPVPEAAKFGPAPDGPFVEIVATPSEVMPGEQVRLTWRSGEVSSCLASDQWQGIQAEQGTAVVQPNWTGLRQYSLTCKTGLANQTEVSAAAAVKVQRPTAPAQPTQSTDNPFGNEPSSVVQ